MSKTILITGATDGIGLLTAQKLAADGHKVLLHGRSADKLDATLKLVGGDAETYLADLAIMSDVRGLGKRIIENHSKLDVVINNAGVLKAANVVTEGGYDLRFMVNTFAPYVLARDLLLIIPKEGRIVNLSSAAQAPVQMDVLKGLRRVDDMAAYSQSKLAITIWSQEMAKELSDGPVVVSVNPGSLLASKMVKEGFGIAGNDLNIGADILYKAALDVSFASASGQYFDNDNGSFASPHPAALDQGHCDVVMAEIEKAVENLKI